MRATATVQPGAEGWSADGEWDRAGTVVVLVHGLTGNPRATRPLGEHLHRLGFSVDVPRLPGHGTTPSDLARTTYGDWRTAVTTAVDAGLRAGDRVVLLGHSMGGTLALDLGGHRDDLAAVVAINPLLLAPPSPLDVVAPILGALPLLLPRSVLGMPTDDIARPDGREDAYPWVSTRAARSLLVALPRVAHGLEHLTVPLLLVSSRVDHTVDPVNSDEVAALVGSRDLRRWWAERSWHLPQLDWEREEVEQVIGEFVVDVHEAATT